MLPTTPPRMGVRPPGSQPILQVRHRCPVCGLDYTMHSCPVAKPTTKLKPSPVLKARIDYVLMIVLMLLASLLTVLAVLVVR
jgi:hypothetical protein